MGPRSEFAWRILVAARGRTPRYGPVLSYEKPYEDQRMTDKATSEYFITGNRLGIVFECGPQSQTALLRAFPWLRSIRDGFESNRPLAPVGTQASMPDAANRADDVGRVAFELGGQPHTRAPPASQERRQDLLAVRPTRLKYDSAADGVGRHGSIKPRGGHADSMH